MGGGDMLWCSFRWVGVLIVHPGAQNDGCCAGRATATRVFTGGGAVHVDLGVRPLLCLRGLRNNRPACWGESRRVAMDSLIPVSMGLWAFWT
jgi:hypothetical protein